MPTSIFSGLVRAFAQLGDPRLSRVVWIGVGGALLGFLGLTLAVEAVLAYAPPSSHSWINDLLGLLGGAAVVGLAYLLFPAVAVSISSLLLDQVVDAVERRHYPGTRAARQPGWVEVVLQSLRFFLVMVVLNIVCLPVYLLAPGLNLLVFYGLNGYLLSREYFELVAFRHLEPEAARRLRRLHGLRLFSAGVVVAFLSTIPVLNLIMPVVAAAFMVHLFHAMIGPMRRNVAPVIGH